MLDVRRSKEELVTEISTLRSHLEQLQAERSISSSDERRLHLQASLLDSVRESVIAADLDGRVTYWGNGAQRLYGYLPEEVLGQPLTVIMGAEDQAPDLDHLRQAREEGCWSGRCLQRRKDDSHFWSDAAISLTHDDHGQAGGYVRLDRDITEQVQAEDSLRESERNLRAICDNVPVTVYSVKPDGSSSTLFVSDRVEELTGYAPQEFYDDPDTWVSVLHPEDRERVWAELESHRRHNTHLDIEYRLVTRDGVIRWVRDAAAPVLDEHGQITRIDGFMEDVTPRKNALEDRQRSQQNLQFVLDNVPAVIWLKDTNGRYQLINRAYEKLHGLSAAVVLGRNDVDIHHPELADRFTSADREVARTHRPLELEETIPGDEPRTFITKKVPVFGDDGEITGILGIATDVTDRKRSEEALRESEERYRNFVTHSGEGIYRVDIVPPAPIDLTHDELVDWISRNAVVAEINDTLARMYGLARTDMIGHPATDFAPDYGERAALTVRDPRYQVVGQETTDVDKNGRPLYLIESFHGEVRDGHLLRVWGVQCDITERRAAEAQRQAHHQLLESLEIVDRTIREATDVEQMLGSVMEAVLNIFDCDRAWLLHPADPEAETFRVPVEATRPEYPGALALDREIPTSEAIVQDLRDVLASDEPIARTAEVEDPVALETARDFQVLSQMFVSLHPKVGKAWLIGLHQCSYARTWTAAEKTLLKEIGRRVTDGLSSLLFLRDLRESEERFQLAVEGTEVGVWDWGVASGEVYWSPRLFRQLGYEPGEVQPTFDAAMSMLHPDDTRRLMQAILAHHKDRHTFCVEVRSRVKSGEYRWFRTSGSSTWNAAGHPTRMIGMLEDIDDRKRAEMEKETLETQLRHSQKLEAVGQLAGGVAHDFNNILTAILGNVELLQAGLRDRLAPGDPIWDGLEQIGKSGERAATLTRQLLAFGRKQLIKPEVLDPATLLANVQKMLRRLIREDIELDIDCEPQVWPIRADAGQVEQVIMNLIVNARDAMEGHGRISVRGTNVTLDRAYTCSNPEARTGRHVVLSVSDTGEGMERETLGRIFEPFFTTKGVGEGTGLGLAMVHGIVRQAHGHIAVESQPGQGTTFRVYLPAVERAPETSETSETRNDPLEGDETILVCEDDRAVRDLTVRALQKSGYTVLAASEPEQALEMARSHATTIHLLLTDVIMPGMNGQQLAQAALAIQPQMSVLYVSGYTNDVIGGDGALDNGVDFLAKPFSSNDLRHRVRRNLDLQTVQTLDRSGSMTAISRLPPAALGQG